MMAWRRRRRRTKLVMVGSSAHSITLTLYTGHTSEKNKTKKNKKQNKKKTSYIFSEFKVSVRYSLSVGKSSHIIKIICINIHGSAHR